MNYLDRTNTLVLLKLRLEEWDIVSHGKSKGKDKGIQRLVIRARVWWTWVWVNSGSWWWTGSLVCCNSWGRKESDTTERLNWTELMIEECPEWGQRSREMAVTGLCARFHFYLFIFFIFFFIFIFNQRTVRSCWRTISCKIWSHPFRKQKSKSVLHFLGQLSNRP